MRHRSFLTGLIALSAVTAGCAWSAPHRATETRVLAAAHVPSSALSVETRNGSVSVMAEPARSDVAIEAKITCTGATEAEAARRLAATSIRIDRDTSGTLVIQPVFPQPAAGGDGASLTIRLPDAQPVTIDTSNGAVHVEGLQGRLVADTSNGGVRVVGHTGDVEVDTSNGAIVLENVVGTVRADTSNGAITATGLAGACTLDSSNGSIDVRLAEASPGPVTLMTSNGSIRLSVGSGFHGDVTLDTSNAPITVHDAGGRIISRAIERGHGHIVIGKGGGASRLNTSNGRIELTIEPGAASSAAAAP
jgi:hypothetical protein